ncbi:MAG: cyclic nucleotide-binding domain-containing protein [Candidatus Muirbacterium halophilum]|nr:cyclic nucleotide-binding domain-containing protein [Candidatus Muirbacterium halophilum]MCK9474482.1 cyclic nucleotide-binding domain-containing protein [Candidatus Muirbacterium halophilum]
MANLKEFQKEVAANTELFREGDHSVETYLLLKGEVEVLKGDQKVAIINDVGTFIGEMGTLLNHPRSATVRTVKDSLFVVIEPVDFEKVIQAQPNIAFKLCKILAIRLQETTNELCKMQLKSNSKDNNIQNKNSDSDVDISELIEEGNLAYKDKDFEKAIKVYEDIIKEDSDNVEVYGKLSNAYFSINDIDNAILNMEKCVNIMPENVKFRNNLAVFYFKNKQQEKAIDQWEEIVKIEPSNEKALNNLKKLKK